MLGYLPADIICFEKRTVSYEEKIMSKDKYPSMFPPYNGVYCLSNLYRHARCFENWEILHEGGGIFSHVTSGNVLWISASHISNPCLWNNCLITRSNKYSDCLRWQLSFGRRRPVSRVLFLPVFRFTQTGFGQNQTIVITGYSINQSSLFRESDTWQYELIN